MDQPTSSDAPTDAFRIARRGYDRQQVDAHVKAAEERIGTLDRRIHELESGMSELGLNRPTDLATELDLVGEEVKRVLNEARVAAEQMRSRSADDAARWRAEADAESRAVRESIRALAYEARGAVWETGTEMIAAAVAQSESLVAGATERALFIQAEAEREASHLTGDARREREESVRATRDEAETLVASARQEAESLLSAARRQADAAEERARALEVRRTELMAELEAARSTIAGVEADAESEAVVDAEPEADDDVPVAPDEVLVVASGEDTKTHWPEDEGSVKIVSPSRVFTAEPVDADAMAAEVEALRESPGAEAATSYQLPAASPEPETPTSSVPAPHVSSPSGGGVAEGDGEGQPESETLESVSELDPSSVRSAEGRGDAEERSDEAGGQPTPEPESEPASAPDPLAGLFAQLRDPEPTSPPTADVSSPSGGGGSGEVVDGGGQVPEFPAEPTPPGVSPTETEEHAEEQAIFEPDPVADPKAVAAPAPTTDLDPFELRERLLLPVQNRALRTVKRHLVEAQNRSLEDLRLTEGWEPDGSIVADEVFESLAVLTHESMVAGFTAAAEMLGTIETPQPDAATAPDLSEDFATALLEATQASIARSRASGAGQRETGASLSRVFRSWRTDDAERRVRFASRSAYHVGVTAALADLGVTEAAVAESGRACPECPANKGPWRIGDGPPAGTSAPPARLECACTVVPSR